MNFFPSPYYTMIYQQPYPENNISHFPESSFEDQNLRYVRILESQNKLLKEKVELLEKKLKSYEEIEKESQTKTSKRKKVQKQDTAFQCIYPNCKKTYKSSLALNLHIKMKHNGGSIREREAYACQRDNKPKPQININFPPNFLEDYRKRISNVQSIQKESST